MSTVPAKAMKDTTSSRFKLRKDKGCPIRDTKVLSVFVNMAFVDCPAKDRGATATSLQW